jgi:predicted DCC family thiol-disulfide oxidoreductase YuxK
MATSTDPAAIGTGKAVVLYDGRCPFCIRSKALLERLDWRRRLAFRDARDPANLPAEGPALDPLRLLDEMHLIAPDGHTVYHGFAAFSWMAWRLPLLCPLAPLLYVPGVPTLGQRLYLWIARNRFHLVPCHGGVCTLPGFSDASQKRFGV